MSGRYLAADGSAVSRGWRPGGRTVSVVVHIGLALALGVFADVGYRAPGALATVPLLATPWLVLSFSAGRLFGRPALAIFASAVVLEVGLGAYYSWLMAGQGVASGTILVHYRAPVWMALGVGVGAAMGSLSAATKHRRRWVREAAWGIVVAVPAIDLFVPRDFDADRYGLLTIALLVIAGALAAWARRAGRAALVRLIAWSVPAAVIMGECELMVLRVALGRNV